ncbi:MAG: hypothetical protein AB2L13_12450 [Spirochaetota bacterium]
MLSHAPAIMSPAFSIMFISLRRCAASRSSSVRISSSVSPCSRSDATFAASSFRFRSPARVSLYELLSFVSVVEPVNRPLLSMVYVALEVAPMSMFRQSLPSISGPATPGVLARFPIVWGCM